MVSPKEAVNKIGVAISEENRLPSNMGVVFHEADTENDDADVDMPLLEFEISESSRPQLVNTDLVGHKLDDDGNQVARIYKSDYELTININLWTAGQSGNDPDDLGAALRQALYPYTSHGPGKSLDDDIYHVVINGGSRNDDLIQTPTVRRWSQEIELWAHEEFRTDEDYIIDVNLPDPDNLDTDDDTLSG